MKFYFFIYVWFVVAIAFLEYSTRVVFQKSCVDVFLSLIIEVPWKFKLMVGFLFGVGGLSFIIFISSRCQEAFVSFKGNPESFVFTGDHLTEGFYGYKENDPQKKEIFIKSSIGDSNQYPRSSFRSLFYRTIVLKSSDGHYIRLNFYKWYNVLFHSIISLTMFMFSYLGFLVLMKSYAISHGYNFNSNGGVADIWKLVISKSNIFNWLIWAILTIHLVIVFISIWNTRKIPNKEELCDKLPEIIKEGNIVMGKVIAHEKYSPVGQDRSHNDRTFYKSFTVQFDAESGFESPVYINWEEQEIHKGNLANKSKSLRNENLLRQEYYNDAFEQLEKAERNNSYFPFYINYDLTILPYLRGKKGMLESLLELKS